MQPMELKVSPEELDRRRAELEANGGYRPKTRQRKVSPALQVYGALATSADKGAVRDVTRLAVLPTASVVRANQ